jgi:hypothetical protein
MARVSPVRSSTWRGDGRTPAIENWVRNSESGGSPRTSLTPFVRSVTLSDAHAHIANTDLQLALTSSGHPLRAVEHGSGNTETALADPDIVNGKVDARDRIVDGLDSTREVRQVPVCRTELLKRHRDCYPLADEVPQLGDHLLIAHWPSLQNYCFPCVAEAAPCIACERPRRPGSARPVGRANPGHVESVRRLRRVCPSTSS